MEREAGDASFETDRMQFIGRGSTVANPQAMTSAAPLSNSAGAVLDPIVAIRRQIALDGGESVTVDIVTGVAETREAACCLVEKYHDRRLADRVFELAWTHSQVLLRQLNATEADAQLYGRLAGSVIYANPALRADPGVLAQNRRGQSGLWGYGISGDLPIVLVRIADTTSIELVRQIVQAQAYWRLKGLAVDLVIWNEDHSGYRQELQDQIMGLIAAGPDGIVEDRPGGIFVRRAEQIAGEDRILLQIGGARHPQRQPRARCRSRWSGADRLKPAAPELSPVRPYKPERAVPVGAAQRSGLLQRPRRIHAGWARVHHHHHAEPDHAGALGQRDRQRAVSAPSSPRAAGLIPGRKTPTSSA